MTDTGFLRAVLADPDDDVTRLAHADWLLENGHEARGEFIQVQIRIARRAERAVGPGGWCDAALWPALRKREEHLLAAHGQGWAGIARTATEEYTFRRGYVEEVRLTAAQFLAHGDALFATHPIRRIRFSGPLTPRVLASPLLARLSGLDLTGLRLGDAALRTILASPHLAGLTWLELDRCGLSDRGALDLAASPLLARLTHLGLANNRISLDGVAALCRSPRWGKVRSLNLKGTLIDARAQAYLTETLAGSHDVSLLGAMLQLTSRGQRDYTSAPVRHLAERAAAGDTPAVLAEGLGAGQRRVRAAAAYLLSNLGRGGAAALPALVQRLFDRDPRVRDHAAPALGRLSAELSPEMQMWVCLLVNPLQPPGATLRRGLEREDLPGEVRAAFHAICFRRVAWRERLGGGPVPPAPWVTAAEAADWVADHAGRHEARRGTAGVAGAMHRESAWLLARLIEALQAEDRSSHGSTRIKHG